MNQRLKDLLNRKFQLPWWALLVLLAALLAMQLANSQQRKQRLRALWHDESRAAPRTLESVKATQEFDSALVDAWQVANELIVEGYPAVNPSGARTRNDLGCIYALQGNEDEAAGLLEESLAAYRAMLGEDHEDTQTVRANLESVQSRPNENIP